MFQNIPYLCDNIVKKEELMEIPLFLYYDKDKHFYQLMR